MRTQTAFVLLLQLYGSLAYKDPHCADGRTGVVQLFEWRWDDIAAECKNFFGPYGFCAIQTSPATENRVISMPTRPWWERFQPVSYKIATRSGNETEFQNMVKTCADSGVSVYVKAVINHMTSGGSVGVGTGGSHFDGNTLDFPGVPYNISDFNDGHECPTLDGNIHDFNDVKQVRNCRLVNLLDLRLANPYVRGKIADYFNHLVELGVAGFQIDASKHMWPDDLKKILDQVKDVQMGGRPFVYHEVIDYGGEPIKGDEYLEIGRVTNFKFGRDMGMAFRKHEPLKNLQDFGEGTGLWASGDVVNFLDNPDEERGFMVSILTNSDPKLYKLATAFMLAHPYGIPRILSSYHFDVTSREHGPPQNADMSIKHVVVNGMNCSNGWICEHRWSEIYNMVAFRNMAAGKGMSNWWSNANYQIAFSRGDRAFIAFNLEDTDLDQTLTTGLAAGTYCDVISGYLENDKCTGKSVTVNADGTARIQVCAKCEQQMLAIHVGAKVGSPAKRY
ncbi:alpha-amylase [Aplysia californica]|uniref:Alpha-amylase n=1 Tax=Aplysia californica TaxID=6500 RepID=A0ABM1A7U8_APLCA|nr:alpha-amylase [Aplysia californica]